jgi:ABC-type nitrate/sulfonate/bicarbonate transport system permease component
VRRRLIVWALRILALAGILGSWLYATGPGEVSPILIPKVSLVWEQVKLLVSSGDIWGDVGITLFELVAAFTIALVAGVLVGFVCGRTPLRAEVAEPLIAWGYLVPLVLFYPLFILWFGVGVESKIAYGALSGFFPIAYNSLRGFRAIDQRFLRVARAFGATNVQTDWQVKTPAALPMMLAGIRIGAALCMITVILAEMLASTRGLGYELARSSQTLQVPRAFALILILLVFVVIVQWVINYFGKERYRIEA